jgi:hypothetical protein
MEEERCILVNCSHIISNIDFLSTILKLLLLYSRLNYERMSRQKLFLNKHTARSTWLFLWQIINFRRTKIPFITISESISLVFFLKSTHYVYINVYIMYIFGQQTHKFLPFIVGLKIAHFRSVLFVLAKNVIFRSFSLFNVSRSHSTCVCVCKMYYLKLYIVEATGIFRI